MKRLIPLIVLACLALGVLAAVVLRGDGLPRSFVMTLSADLTSSGGGRTYAGTLDVTGDQVSGTGHYEFSRETKTEYDCILANGTWSSTDDGTCQIPLTIPATRTELADAVRSGSIMPTASCGHKQLCYAVVAR